jgi:hypothetical protein
MIFISHRGNINGSDPEMENNPVYIEKALSLGYDVEVDVRFFEDRFWLGHDKPQYPVDYKFLMNEKLWCHAKNIEALFEMKKYSIHYFWHEYDNVTLTSKNYVWAYPRVTAIKGSIAVLPEISNGTISGCKGVCSDLIENYRKKWS